MLDDVRVVGDDAGDEHLALGQRDVLPEPPLVLVADVGLLDQVVARLDGEHEVDDVLERRVEGVRRRASFRSTRGSGRALPGSPRVRG